MEVLTAVDAGRIEDLRARGEFFWLDLHEPADEELGRAGKALGLHPLAVEDSREFNQRPKLDRYPQGLLLVFWSARITPNRLAVEPVETHLHISGDYLATVRRGICKELDDLHDQVDGLDPDHEDYLIYLVLDALTDALLPVVDNLEERIDQLEGEVLTGVVQRQIGRIFRLKQEVQAIHRPLVPQHDSFPGAIHAIMELPGLEHDKREYLRDVGDHLVQAAGELQRQIDDLTTLTSTYFNANANRLNRLLTRLTVMGTFFLIWTLVTSFFGQNFGWLVRHINSFSAFTIYQTISLVVPTIVAAIYFWRRRGDWM